VKIPIRFSKGKMKSRLKKQGSGLEQGWRGGVCNEVTRVKEKEGSPIFELGVLKRSSDVRQRGKQLNNPLSAVPLGA